MITYYFEFFDYVLNFVAVVANDQIVSLSGLPV